MISIQVEDFDLGKIADSGQCFRMNYIGKGTYSVIAFDKYVEVSQHLDTVFFSCNQEEYDSVWKQYFDIDTDTDYKSIKENAKADQFLKAAMDYSSGIRILRQDLWEMIITFIISQRKSVNSIKECVDKLCKRYGEVKTGIGMSGNQITYYTFPTPEIFSKVPVEDLRACSLGYRDVYIHEASLWCYDNLKQNPEDNHYQMVNYTNITKSYTYAKSVFNEITGVGDKIANCICLFALHQLEACPIDTHMKQIIDKVYKGIMPEWMVSDKAGVLQQYAFYYKRLQY